LIHHPTEISGEFLEKFNRQNSIGIVAIQPNVILSGEYRWAKNSSLCEIFVVEGKMIVEISVNFRSFHSENTIGLAGQGRSF
jgi:hypothetical protein